MIGRPLLKTLAAITPIIIYSFFHQKKKTPCLHNLITNRVKNFEIWWKSPDFAKNFKNTCTEWARNNYSFTELNHDGLSILHLASTCCDHEEFNLVEYIISVCQKYERYIDVNVLDSNGQSALYLAISTHNLRSATSLIEAGAQPVDWKYDSAYNDFKYYKMQCWRDHFEFLEDLARRRQFGNPLSLAESKEYQVAKMRQKIAFGEKLFTVYESYEEQCYKKIIDKTNSNISGIIAGYLGFFCYEKDDEKRKKIHAERQNDLLFSIFAYLVQKPYNATL